MSHVRRSRSAGTIEPRSSPAPGSRGHSTLARLVGATGLVALTALLFWMLTDSAFTVTPERITFRGLENADEDEVRAHLVDIERGPNVFRVRASELVSQLSTLTEVQAASARVTLPADISIRLDERDPVFIWTDRAVSWLVDEEGMLFAPVDPEGETAAMDPASDRARLPTIVDARLPAEPPTVGTYLPALDLAVMRQLLALDSELLGPRTEDLELSVDEQRGYVLTSRAKGWYAQFGHYSPHLQPPEVIPLQVQCLQALLGSAERKLNQIRLAVSEDGCGTFTRYDDAGGRGS